MNKSTTRQQEKIRGAIQWVQSTYRKAPWMFISESDVQCYFYARLLEYSSKPRRVKVLDADDKRQDENSYHVLTQPLHAELSSSYRKGTEFVDLCLLNPSRTTFWIRKTKFDCHEKVFPIWDWDWAFEDTIGIEIKFNRWIVKTTAYSRRTKRTRVTKRWRRFRRSLIRDFKKLTKFQRGWLIFVDQHSLFANRKEWRDFVDGAIRDANGKAKKTLNAYYLCPKMKKAVSFKSGYNSF